MGTKKTALAVLLLGLSTTVLLADFFEPFTDSQVGKTVTGKGWLIADSDGKSGFAVVVFTDTGYRVLSAVVGTDFDVQPVLGREATITATIQAGRSLLVSRVEVVDTAKEKAK